MGITWFTLCMACPGMAQGRIREEAPAACLCKARPGMAQGCIPEEAPAACLLQTPLSMCLLTYIVDIYIYCEMSRPTAAQAVYVTA